MKFTGERYLPKVEGWLSLQHFHRYYFVLNQLRLDEKTILDIACGEGYGSEILSRKAKVVYGIDISKESIEHANKEYQRPNLIFKEGDVANIPLGENSVDIVVSFETIEHVDNQNQMIKEIKRILKPDGIIIISSPDRQYYDSNLPNLKNEFHVHELYFDEFRDLIRKYFINTYIYNQNNFLGSIINSNSNSNINEVRLFDKKTGNEIRPDARINIIIASNIEVISKIDYSICIDPTYQDIFDLVEKQSRIIRRYQESNLHRLLDYIFNILHSIKRKVKKWYSQLS